MKTLWSTNKEGQWCIIGIKSLEIKSPSELESHYFRAEGDLEILTNTPSQNVHEALASFGSVDFLLKQSILPVVTWKDGDDFIRCIGTASVISCTGYLLTAAHVLLDPFENSRSARGHGGHTVLDETQHLGVFIPISSAYGVKGFRYFPIEKYWLWGQWKESPLIHEADSFEYLTDIAVCKVAGIPEGAAHQPLSLSVNSFSVGEGAYSIGYAEMEDIPIEYDSGNLTIKDFKMDLYVSVGEVKNLFPQNHLIKEVPTPGPCFDFDAKIPGKMSGAPIFGAEGVIIRGVVSRSFSGERHAYGAMLGAAMDLFLDEPEIKGRSLRKLIDGGHEGMTQVFGSGL